MLVSLLGRDPARPDQPPPRSAFVIAALLKLASSGPPDSPERQVLRDAIAVKTLAERALTGARTRTARVQSIIDSVDCAEREATRAQRAAKDAARNWAATGATASRREHEEALTRARAAEQHAEQARLEAKGAEEAITGLRGTEQDAKHVVEEAESKVRAAAARVIWASAEPLRLQHVADEAPGILADVAKFQALRRMAQYHSHELSRRNSLLTEVEKLATVTSDLTDNARINTWEVMQRLESHADAALDDLWK